MTQAFLVAAPLLIAAVVMAVRFVGCSFQPGTGATYSTIVLETPNLVSFWRLNESSGYTAADSNDGNNGTYDGAITYHVTGLVSPDDDDTDNFAARLDGQTAFVSVPFDANVNPPMFTVEALVQPAAIDTNTHVIVSSDTGYRLLLNGSDFEASVGSGGVFQPPVVVNAGAQPNQAYYLAMTYDGTNLQLYVNPAASDGESFFLNDENANNASYNSAPASYQPATSKDLRIGASADGGSPGEFFDGEVQNVAVYDRALNFVEIVTHYWVFATGMTPTYGNPGLNSEGTLSVAAAFPPNAPTSTEFSPAGAFTYDIPYWCTYIDLVLLGGGGGGSNSVGIAAGTGGQAGSFLTVTLQRGIGIPWTTPSISITVGSGGAAATNGGSTTASATGMAPQTGLGGIQGAGMNGTTGESPGTVTYQGQSYTGGVAQIFPGAAGNAPGGGGGGGGPFGSGGAGAAGAAWVVARQT
jgi:Concanavalin A-like lectin/glucanases superfamily